MSSGRCRPHMTAAPAARPPEPMKMDPTLFVVLLNVFANVLVIAGEGLRFYDYWRRQR